MTDNAVYYNDAKDWEDWQMEFRKRAEGEDVWQYIEPTSDLPWPQEPTPPNIADYYSRRSGEEYASHRMEDARIAFKNYLRSAPKKEAGLEKWIVRWKELMAEVEETAPLWASNYRLNKLDAVNNREVSYREVATNLLREIANRRNRSAVPRGSYKAGFLTLHGQQANQDDIDQDDRDT
ncbi:uncharacterized protein NECHADRAFT_89464 [Fusarium vanettenii 77-13-4]|uniref:Uncharacterized protein n=1 Tax=Fusarium vanettenii (strain ATCC MYA-4622 / CBS 123669 / FGSC 9596 / NRRL 45880 / 77-13-4) TaxID=660122 RepID=C7ZR94_FUSV7|nr:uncharacterized protein NECHADRAFT_89464 [Fusarium vanettenii 77-13-4]EEU33463.1 predicted protein [Fusarium vanettenii 77-13-4]